MSAINILFIYSQYGFQKVLCKRKDVTLLKY